MIKQKLSEESKETNGQDTNRAEEQVTLPDERLEKVRAWGGASESICYVYRPTNVAGVREVFELAQRSGRSVGLCGGGNSYGDAFMNAENIVLDLRRMSRILEWNPENGRIRVEPGVTLEQLWVYIVEDGWWPPISTGTMKTTMGGCAAMNVHGKNAWPMGHMGDNIIEFEMILPAGNIITCSREQNSDIFHAAIGGFGMLGCFTSLTLQMKRIYSGLLHVETTTQPTLARMFRYFEENVETADYLVGWIDAFAKGRALGRGDVHKATYLPPGEDPYPSQTLRLGNQHLAPNLFGFFPRSVMWLLMRPFINNPGMRFINMGKYWAGRLGGMKRFYQPHAQFHFLLDYIPDWKKSYEPGGLIQYQPFIPKENALETFAKMLRLGQRRGLPNYLTVLKRHRPDDFLMSYGLDGYSLAMDFRITNKNRHRVAALARELDELVLAAGGRFYFAKDSTLRPETAVAYLGEETIAHFHALKERCDPDHILQTNLWRRVFGPTTGRLSL